ncbi:hypothetical protein JCGZ_24375 [Jatropha curcas]|uniref:Uncharacterized protein n=2 Tax=Jatropha curcas TaxID=180498 RepID=A0A067L299_JATCU|nr:hypothetical protein JCGZ_24375 [Jatropha curcas]
MRSNKVKEKVVLKDDEVAKDFGNKEHVDDTWQDDEFFKKMFAKKAESEPIVSEKSKKLDKKFKKLHLFMKSKGIDGYVDLDDDDDEELELKQVPL